MKSLQQNESNQIMPHFHRKTNRSKNVAGIEVMIDSVNVYAHDDKPVDSVSIMSFWSDSCGLKSAGPNNADHDSWHSDSEFSKDSAHFHAVKCVDALITPAEFECFLNEQQKRESSQIEFIHSNPTNRHNLTKSDLPHLDPSDREDLIQDYKVYYEANKNADRSRQLKQHEAEKIQHAKKVSERQKHDSEEFFESISGLSKVKDEIISAGFATGKAFLHAFIITMIDKYFIPRIIETFNLRITAQNALKTSLHAATTFIVSLSTIKSSLDFIIKFGLRKYLTKSMDELKINGCKLSSLMNKFSSIIASVQNPLVLIELYGAYEGACSGEQAAHYLIQKLGKSKIEDEPVAAVNLRL